MNDKEIEALIAKAYGQNYTLQEEQIERMMMQATMPQVFMIIQRPVIRWTGLASFMACIAAGVFSGMSEAQAFIQTAEVTAQGLEHVLAGLSGGFFI